MIDCAYIENCYDNTYIDSDFYYICLYKKSNLDKG